MTSSPSSTRESSAKSSRFFEPGVSTMFSNSVGHPGVTRDVRGGALAHLADAACRRVVGRAVAHRANGRVDDVLGSGEVGLADLEVDDAATLGLEPACVREDLEGAFGAESGQSFRESDRHDATIIAGSEPVRCPVLHVDPLDASMRRTLVQEVEHALARKMPALRALPRPCRRRDCARFPKARARLHSGSRRREIRPSGLARARPRGRAGLPVNPSPPDYMRRSPIARRRSGDGDRLLGSGRT